MKAGAEMRYYIVHMHMTAFLGKCYKVAPNIETKCTLVVRNLE